MIGLIVAHTKNRVIGKDGSMPWNIPGELSRFRELTTGNVVIMGRRTYESIGKPLPNRYNIILSKTQRFETENCTTAGSLEEALRIAGDRDIFIGGGGKLYEKAIPLVDKMYITEIDAVIDGDTFFPEFDKNEFIREVEKTVDGELPYEYVTYTRKEA